MKPYVVQIKLIPDPQKKAPQLREIGGGMATIWVFETQEKRAIDKAIRYCESLGWQVKELVFVSEMLPGQLAQLDKREAMNYRHAELLGINGHFDAWKIQDQPGVYSVESLRKPPKKDDKKTP